MTKAKTQIGQEGEKLASEYLRQKGLKIIEKNWRGRWGEIDLIARDGQKIFFIEVKTRHSQSFGLGLDAVDARKQAKIAKTALLYLQKHPKDYEDIRLAVLSIDYDKSSQAIQFVEFPLDGMGRYY